MGSYHDLDLGSPTMLDAFHTDFDLSSPMGYPHKGPHTFSAVGIIMSKPEELQGQGEGEEEGEEK